MEQVAIAELTPELSALESKQFRAVVILIWPYSSSVRQFALLLGDPDFRRRRRSGQVRARFSGSSAKAIASTGVGIGDEVVLSLRGAEFIQDGAVSTPGKSIDWELLYTQTLSAHVIRSGSEIATLDLNNVAPTPALRSPIRRQLPAVLDESRKWSSPAFIKRIRLSEGPVFEAGYDPFTDDTEDRHDRKRRRKSYRDWNAWTYSARTPSPEKEDVDMEDYDALDASPICPANIPETLVSPPKPGLISVAGLSLPRSDGSASEDEYQLDSDVIVQNGGPDSQSDPNTSRNKDDFVRDADYYDLYAGPNEFPPPGPQDMFEGGTQPNTEDEAGTPATLAAGYVDTVESDAEGSRTRILQPQSSDAVEVLSVSEISEVAEEITVPAEHYSVVEVEETTPDDNNMSLEYEQCARERSGTANDLIVLDDAPEIIMPPPPALPLLQTDFQNPFTPGLLTPIGKEPSSPTLLPLDSATLPMPSPFPGERDENAMSYLEHFSSSQLDIRSEADRQHPEHDEEYTIKSSFYSSLSASNAPAFHGTHESAFTDVRFNFGMDGSAFSRPAAPLTSDDAQDTAMALDESTHAEEVAGFKGGQEEDINDGNAQRVGRLPAVVTSSPQPGSPEPQKQLEIIELSSDSDLGDADDNRSELEHKSKDQNELAMKRFDVECSVKPAAEQAEEGRPVSSEVLEEEQAIDDQAKTANFDHPTAGDELSGLEPFDEFLPLSTERSTVATEVIDLGSGFEDESHAEDIARRENLSATLPGRFGEVDRISYPDAKANKRTLPVSREIAHDDEQGNDCFVDYQMQGGFQPVKGEEGASAGSIFYQSDAKPEAEDDEHMLLEDEVQLAADDSHDHMPDATFQHNEFVADHDVAADNHPDIKMESIEEDNFGWAQQESSLVDEDDEPIARTSAELLIAVPDEGHKVGDMQFVTVPATGPARNTRSKTKASTSPVKEAPHSLKRSARSKKPKANIAPIARTTLSPFAPRSMSVTSPTKDATATSPYSLRSQSKLLSPKANTTPIAERKRTRKLSARLSSVEVKPPHKDTFADEESFHSADLNLPDTSFGPSQEPSMSQTKFANVQYVKDSEEGSLHSENSLSTVQYSDDWNIGTQIYTNVSDLVGPNSQVRDNEPSPLRPRPTDRGSSPAAPLELSAKTRWKTEQQVEISAKSASPQPAYSFLTQPAQGSPRNRLRSMTPIETASSSPHRLRRLKRDMYDIPIGDDALDEHTPRPATTSGVAYPAVPAEAEDNQLGSSSPASLQVDQRAAADFGEQLPSSPPVGQSKIASVNEQSLRNSNMPMTPDATQQTFAESQPSLPAYQQKHSMPMTPQLTQTTSAGLRSPTAGIEMEEVASEPPVESLPTTQSAPRRTMTGTHVASKQASPITHSANISDAGDKIAPVPQSEPPSIGLSTPIAYYTPIKDLPFFLNRSSQFHSSTWPDTLALVTSASTPPKRASSGPKHYSTTFHIVDLSSYPTSTTVQVFRPYANALPVAEKGDVVLLRAFSVKSLNRRPVLVSGEESAWCVWRYSKLLWGRKRGPFGEVREREEVKGPFVERGEGEWREVEKIRAWYLNTVQGVLEEKERDEIKTRSKDKGKEKVDGFEAINGDAKL